MSEAHDAQRDSSRIILLNEKQEVLLFHFRIELPDELRVFWATPGGELKAGECTKQAAKRELFEETGLSCAAVSLSNLVWFGTFYMDWKGRRTQCNEHYFVGYCRDVTIDTSRMTDEERSVIVEYRWWSIAALAKTDERFYPFKLIDMLKALQDNQLPHEAVRIELE